MDDTGGAGDTGGNGATPTGGGKDSGAGGSGGTAVSEGGVPPTPGACQAPATAPAICDPVKNFGCLVPFSFCDIDTAQAIASGRCVFPWSTMMPPPNGCFTDATTETCMPMSTCVNGTCKKLCYCDSDCGAGECCTEPAPGASKVFKLCKAC
jgi:hypothetical protein